MAGDVGSSHVRTDFGELSDAELVRATRDGSRRAYAALYARHSLSALKYAKTLTSSDADDVVSEVFLKVYAAVKAGLPDEQQIVELVGVIAAYNMVSRFLVALDIHP